MKRHPDPRYYLCPDHPCLGQVAPVLRDEAQRPVFVCMQCGRHFKQITVDQAYRLRRMQDKA